VCIRTVGFQWKANPRKFIIGYQTAITSTEGDAQTLAKSLIMALKDISHDWYTSLKPLSIHSWSQVKAELLSTFQGYHPGRKTTSDENIIHYYPLAKMQQKKAKWPSCSQASL
jgi:hypothetical protein